MRTAPPERIDIVARVCVPVAFLCFNIVYWSIYLTIATKQRQSMPAA
jgi:hypothetical protein